MTRLMSRFACTALEAPTDRTSLAMPAIDRVAMITSFNQPHIIMGEIAFWGVLEDIQNLGSVLGLSFFSLLSNPTSW